MKSIFTGLFILLDVFVSAQFEEKTKAVSHIVQSLSINNDFNGKDWYIGLSAGVEDLGYEWGARIGFNFRPFYQKTTIEDGNIIRQYREQKYFLSIDLDKRFVHFEIDKYEIQFFGGVKTGLLFGNYKGTQNNAKMRGILAPMGGICFNSNDLFFVKVGYCLFNDGLKEVSDGRITLTVILAL